MHQRCPAQVLPLLLPAQLQSPPAGKKTSDTTSGSCLQNIAPPQAAEYGQRIYPKHRMCITVKHQVLTFRQFSKHWTRSGNDCGLAPWQTARPVSQISALQPEGDKIIVSTTWQRMTTMTRSRHRPSWYHAFRVQVLSEPHASHSAA